jgi:diacylglycerol kinase family enzyme
MDLQGEIEIYEIFFNHEKHQRHKSIFIAAVRRFGARIYFLLAQSLGFLTERRRDAEKDKNKGSGVGKYTENLDSGIKTGEAFK